MKKIVNDLAFITAHTSGITREGLERDEVLADSMMFRLIQISENADRLSDGFKATRPHIPWRAVKGLRNRIVHDYGEIDMTVIYDTI